jgi:hypothetical protein
MTTKKEKSQNTIAKVRMPLADLIQFATLVTMPGTLTVEDETKRKKAVLFPEFEGIAKDGKIKVIMANKTANVYTQLSYNCEVLQPGDVWCGHNEKLSEYASAMKVDGDVVIEFDKTIILKASDVTVKMRNIGKELLQYPAAARSVNEKFIMTGDVWKYKAPDGTEKDIDARFRVNVADLKPIINDGSLMDQVYYPVIMTKGTVTENEADLTKPVIVVQAKNEFDSIERRIVPIETNDGEFSTDYQVGIDCALLNLSGEIIVRAGSKTPMIIISESEKYKMILFIAPRVPDTESQITDDMFIDGVDVTPTTMVEAPSDGDNESGEGAGSDDDFV